MAGKRMTLDMNVPVLQTQPLHKRTLESWTSIIDRPILIESLNTQINAFALDRTLTGKGSPELAGFMQSAVLHHCGRSYISWAVSDDYTLLGGRILDGLLQESVSSYITDYNRRPAEIHLFLFFLTHLALVNKCPGLHFALLKGKGNGINISLAAAIAICMRLGVNVAFDS